MTDRPLAPPDDALRELLPPDVRGELTDLRHPEAIEVWHGVVWSRLGRGDLAWAWWDGVGSADLAPWVAAERGRVARELGVHEVAERYDTQGLEAATDIVDVCMLRIGLAADAVGRGEVGTARMRLDAASSLLATLPESPRVARQHLRRTWVEVEVAFLAGEQPPIEELPWWTAEEGATLPPRYDHGSRFHAAKGLLFAGIARDDGRLLDAAADLAPPMLRWAVELARDDRHREGALRKARETWAGVVAPDSLATAASRTATAERLQALRRPML